MPSVGGPKAAIARYFRVWNTGQSSDAEDLFDDDYIDHAHPGVTDLSSFLALVSQTRADDPQVGILVDAVMGDRGDMFTVIGRAHDAAAYGEGILGRVWIFRFRGGRIAEMWMYRDPANTDES